MALLEDARNSRITFGDSRDGLEGALGSNAVPIFEYERLDASVIKAAGVSDLAINNNHLCIALGASTCEMARIALSDPGAELKRTKVSMSINDRFRRIFQDAEGLHLLVVMESDEVYYLQQGSSKPRFIKSLKMSGQKITAVAWDRGSRSKSEKTALIGTSGGFILEMTIDANPQNESKPRVLTVINDEPKQIIGLDVQTTSKSYTVIAATALKLFMYNGTGNLRQQEFEVVKNCKVLSVPLMDPEGCFSIFRGNWNQEPSFFGWAYKQNISVGSIVFETEMETGSFVGTPSLTRIEDSTKDTAPLSIAFTTFHILVLYRDRIVAINRRSFKEVHEVTFSEMEVVGEPGRLIRDESTGKIWLFTHKSIFALVMKNESRNEWLYCLEKNQFSEALSFCTDDSQREAVNMAQGEYLLSKKMYKEASQSLAATKKPVEELALKLISPDKSDDLKSYLRAKLRYIPETEIIQKILLYTWLLELYLTQLRKTPKIDLEIEFDQFLAEVIPESWFKTHIIKMTHNMILDHGRLRQLVSFSERVQNFDFVIHFYINEQKYNSALKVLIDQDIPELYYKFSPLLIKSIPYQLISAWKNTSKRLNLKKLIPAFTDRSFLSTNPKAISMIIEYIQEQLRNGDQEGLDGMIDEMVSSLTDNLDIFNFDVEDDTAIHNLIVALLLEFCDEQSTIKYLQSENAKYDKFFTLYLCNKLGKKKLSVVVYGEMKLYEDAVALALAEGAPQLARVYASKAEGQQRKKLWLVIAKAFFTKDYWDNTASAQQSMDIAEHLKTGDLQIEDILSFFESETIDGVDEHIRTAFKGYQSKIEKLIQDMDEATFSSDQIRHEIEATPNKFGFVDDQRKCDQCSKLLFTQPFYLFPCLHAFHCRCLEDQHRQFRFENNVLDECIFCGTAMIDSVSVSILKDNERDPSWFI